MIDYEIIRKSINFPCGKLNIMCPVKSKEMGLLYNNENGIADVYFEINDKNYKSILLAKFFFQTNDIGECITAIERFSVNKDSDLMYIYTPKTIRNRYPMTDLTMHIKDLLAKYYLIFIEKDRSIKRLEYNLEKLLAEEKYEKAEKIKLMLQDVKNKYYATWAANFLELW